MARLILRRAVRSPMRYDIGAAETKSPSRNSITLQAQGLLYGDDGAVNANFSSTTTITTGLILSSWLHSRPSLVHISTSRRLLASGVRQTIDSYIHQQAHSYTRNQYHMRMAFSFKTLASLAFLLAPTFALVRRSNRQRLCRQTNNHICSMRVPTPARTTN